MKIVIALLILGFGCGGCAYINHWCGLKDDNIVEESLEDVIEHETGISIDLTPSTPEE